VAGLLPIDPATDDLISDHVADQARRALTSMLAVVETADPEARRREGERLEVDAVVALG